MKLKPEKDTGYHEYTSYSDIKFNFSSILRKEVILEMLELHDRLRYMRVEYEADDGTIQEGGLQVGFFTVYFGQLHT